MIATVILIPLGSFFCLVGFIIWKFKITGLIAGYDPARVKDPIGLAMWVGKCAIATGIIAILIGIFNYIFMSKNSDIISFVIFMISSMITGVTTLAGTSKFSN
jgi:hypothetical protein